VIYDEIYLLKPMYEDMRGGPGWYKLKWRPLWKKTLNVYNEWSFRSYGFGVMWWRDDADNGWNRSYKCIRVRITLINFTISAWIKWDYMVHRDVLSEVRGE